MFYIFHLNDLLNGLFHAVFFASNCKKLIAQPEFVQIQWAKSVRYPFRLMAFSFLSEPSIEITQRYKIRLAKTIAEGNMLYLKIICLFLCPNFLNEPECIL